MTINESSTRTKQNSGYYEVLERHINIGRELYMSPEELDRLRQLVKSITVSCPCSDISKCPPRQHAKQTGGHYIYYIGSQRFTWSGKGRMPLAILVELEEGRKTLDDFWVSD